MDASALAETFPLMRGGGLFLVLIGLGIAVGGVLPRLRIHALVAGAALGVVAMAVAGITKWSFDGIGYPAWWQWTALGVAALLEGWLVSLVVRRYTFGSREFWLAMLFVVGAHFLVLTVSHGPICGLLAFFCMSNVALAWLLPSVKVDHVWTADGSLKVIGGALMVAVTL